MTNYPHHDLEWLAFRYVLGELTDDQVADWESRLANDQDAREAVAAAVELVQATARAGSEVWRHAAVPQHPVQLDPVIPAPPAAGIRQAVKVPRNWLRSSGWIAAGAALVAVLTVGSRWLDRDTNDSKRLSPAATERANELAIVWSQTRQVSLPDLDAHDDASDTDADEWHSPFDSDSHNTDRALPATPSWVTAAMDGLAEESDGYEPGTESNTVRGL